MRDDYDFSNGIKNPYADKLKKQITTFVRHTYYRASLKTRLDF